LVPPECRRTSRLLPALSTYLRHVDVEGTPQAGNLNHGPRVDEKQRANRSLSSGYYCGRRPMKKIDRAPGLLGIKRVWVEYLPGRKPATFGPQHTQQAVPRTAVALARCFARHHFCTEKTRTNFLVEGRWRPTGFRTFMRHPRRRRGSVQSSLANQTPGRRGPTLAPGFISRSAVLHLLLRWRGPTSHCALQEANAPGPSDNLEKTEMKSTLCSDGSRSNNVAWYRDQQPLLAVMYKPQVPAPMRFRRLNFHKSGWGTQAGRSQTTAAIIRAVARVIKANKVRTLSNVDITQTVGLFFLIFLKRRLIQGHT